MSDEKILAWHFVGDRLRDGRPVPPDGQLLVHVGQVVLYEKGLHAAPLLRDALREKRTSTNTICRVELSGAIEHGGTIVAASERRILWRIPATGMLSDFARRCAWQVREHLPPALRVTAERWFDSGDPSPLGEVEAIARRHARNGNGSTSFASASLLWSGDYSHNWGSGFFAASSAMWAIDWAAGGDPLCHPTAAALDAMEEQNAWLEAAAERMHAGTYETWTPAQETNQAANTVATAVPTAERSEGEL